MTKEDLQVHIAACERNAEHLEAGTLRSVDDADGRIALKACQLLTYALDTGATEEGARALALVLRIGRWER